MSATGQAGGDGNTAGEAQGSEGQPGGYDPGQIAELLDANRAQTLEEMRGLLSQQPAEEPQQQEDGLDLSWLDQQQQQPEYEDPQVAAMRQFFGQQHEQQQAMQQEIARQRDQLQEQKWEMQARDLAAEFPELTTDEMANRIAGPGGLAEQFAQQLGQPALAKDPSFWRIVYMAHKTAEAANQPDGQSGAAPLEAGGGPGPAPQTSEDIVKGIMNSGGLGGKVLDRMQ